MVTRRRLIVKIRKEGRSERSLFCRVSRVKEKSTQSQLVKTSSTPVRPSNTSQLHCCRTRVFGASVHLDRSVLSMERRTNSDVGELFGKEGVAPREFCL